ncbi:MAG: tetratricopeptide repeat protein, partial [Bacteroidota bacterium]|nr:tetratricopeptide repeat protein [Bacteroidota bacterium]
MKKVYSLIGIILLALVPFASFAQPDGTSTIWKFEEGNKLMEEKLYNQASDIWRELLTTDPDNANLNYKLGIALFNSATDRDLALPFLERAAQLRSTGDYGTFNISGYDPFDPRERNAP